MAIGKNKCRLTYLRPMVTNKVPEPCGKARLAWHRPKELENSQAQRKELKNGFKIRGTTTHVENALALMIWGVGKAIHYVAQ